MNLIFNMLLPFVTMGVMNYLIYQAMSKSRRQQQAPPATRASVRGRGGANQINAHAPFLRRSVSNRRQSSLLTRSSSTSASVAESPRRSITPAPVIRLFRPCLGRPEPAAKLRERFAQARDQDHPSFYRHHRHVRRVPLAQMHSQHYGDLPVVRGFAKGESERLSQHTYLSYISYM